MGCAAVRFRSLFLGPVVTGLADNATKLCAGLQYGRARLKQPCLPAQERADALAGSRAVL